MKEAAHTARLNRRVAVLLHARCHASSWKVFNVELSDISESGCCLIGGRTHLRPLQSISLRFADVRNVEAKVRWIERGKVGVEFVTPLARSVIESMKRTYSIPASVPARRGNGSGLGSAS